MFRCDFDVIESFENLEEFGGSEHSRCELEPRTKVDVIYLRLLYTTSSNVTFFI